MDNFELECIDPIDTYLCFVGINSMLHIKDKETNKKR